MTNQEALNKYWPVIGWIVLMINQSESLFYISNTIQSQGVLQDTCDRVCKYNINSIYISSIKQLFLDHKH